MAGADILMQQTLPTIVGMGVVSRTTETMFGRGGRRTTRRKKATSARPRAHTRTKSKTFNGQRYKPANFHRSKSAAQRDAEFFRRQGHNARVVVEGGGYMVYVR